MTTAVDKPPTLTQRANAAVEEAGVVLGLSNSKALSAAISLVALEEIQRNSWFAARIRTEYNALMPSPKPRASGTKRGQSKVSRLAAPNVELVPRLNVQPREANPGAAPDAYYLYELYGSEQLPLALARYKVSDLKLAAELVRQRNPGTKPKGKDRSALINYIVAHVAAN